MIKLENVTIKFDKTIILDDISIEIPEKKIVYVVGKNGSGKSTLAHTISGLNKKYKGKISIDENLLTRKISIKDLRKKLGLVFQNPDNQIVFNTVYEDIRFTLENMNISGDEIDKTIDDCLKTVDMEAYKYANTYSLSGGQKQRIAIASILAMKPSYIIFDEATSMLDPIGKEEIYCLIERLKKTGITVVFITNLLEELIYADEILIIDKHKVFSYSKKEIFENFGILENHGLKLPFIFRIIESLHQKGIYVYDKKTILEELQKL